MKTNHSRVLPSRVKILCTNEMKTQSPSSTKISKHQPVSCSNCQTYIGHLDPFAAGIRLYKWRLQIPTKIPPTIFPSHIYTAQLSSVIQSQVTSRLILLPLDFVPSSFPSQPTTTNEENRKSTYLSLWILFPSIYFSSTNSIHMNKTGNSAMESQPAMKIFYQCVSAAEAEKLMKKEGVEEVYFPGEAIDEIRAELERSRSSLPASGRNFREWEVGLLERYERTYLRKKLV